MNESRSNEDVTDEYSAIASAVSLALPDELSEWVDRNQELVLRVQQALTDTYETFTEEKLWEAIAENCSPEWSAARKKLQTAETEWTHFNSPEQAPLGAIGQALDSEESSGVEERYTVSLADFTIINEGLRQREDLNRLLSVLLVHQRMLERSKQQTQSVLATLAPISNSFQENAQDNRSEEKIV